VAVRAVTGFEFGTTTCWANGIAGSRVVDAATGAPAIVTTSPRNGTYCLEITAAAAVENVAWTTDTLTTGQNRGRCVFAVYFPSSLPAANVVLAEWHSTGWNGELRFNQATGKIAAGMEGGASTDGPTISPDTWYHIELYYDSSITTTAMDWWVDGTAQTQVSRAGGTAGAVSQFNLGSSASQTLTARYDDLLIDTAAAAIPTQYNKHKVVVLKVDPAGTVTLSGTTGNFNTFTANGTLAAWNATTARNNIDELPPVFGASADGFCQITLQTTDYVQIPMTSYTLAGGETIAGLRMVAPGWATSTTAATIGFRSWNGTTETTLLAAADPGFDNTATTTTWVCKMCTLADFDTQSELDALVFRVGFAGDATPDIGIHGIYAELAVKESSGGATATPAAVASVAALPKPDVAVAATLTAAVAAVASLPKPAVSVAATPVTVAAAVALPAPAVSVAAAPAVVASAVALPTPTAGQAGTPATATPATIAAAAAIPGPAVGVAAAPATTAALAALAQPAVAVAATPPPVASAVALPKPAVGVGAAPAAIAALAGLPTPTIPGAGSATATPAATATTAALAKPNLSAGAAPAAVAALTDLPKPAVGVAARPVLVALTAALTAPTVAVHGQPFPATITTLAALPNPAVTIAAVPATITAMVTVPTPLIPAPFDPIMYGLDGGATTSTLDGAAAAGSSMDGTTTSGVFG